MALQKFIFHEGTTENPVVLSQDYVDALIALWADDSVEKDISGVVYKPSLYDSEVDALETIGFTVLTDAQLEDQFTIYPGLEYLNEGEYVDVQANGINAAALSFEILDVKVTYNADNLDEDYIKRKFSFEHNRLVVDSARENASWIAEVTFKAAPQSHPLNYRTAKVTVNAVAISSISITGPSMLNEGDVATYTAQVLPDNNTKPHSAITFTAKYGHFSGNIYTAPVGYSSDEITAMVSAFGRGFSGMKSLVVGTVILNDSDKNPLVFNAIKAALKTSGWTTLGGVNIDEATSMTSIDAYNVSNEDFFNIIKAMKSISVAHTFEEVESFVNVTELTITLYDNDNSTIVFSPNLTGRFALPNLSIINTYANSSYTFNVQKGFLYGTGVSNVDLPKLTKIDATTSDETYKVSSCCIFGNMKNLKEVNMPNLLYLFENDKQHKIGVGDLFYGCTINSVNMPKLRSACRRWPISGNYSLQQASPYAFINMNSVVYDYLQEANQAFTMSKLEALSLGEKTSTLTLGSYMFTNSTKLRSVKMPNLNSIELEHVFYGCESLKRVVSSNDLGIDESFDGQESVLDWSNTKLVTVVSGVNAFYGCASLYKLKLPSSLSNITGNAYIWNNSRVCVIDLRNCRNLISLSNLLYDERSLYSLKFARVSASVPPTIGEASCPVFVPTAKFNVYNTSTNWSKLYVKNNGTNNKIYVYDSASINNKYKIDANVNSGSVLIYEGRFTETSYTFIKAFKGSVVGATEAFGVRCWRDTIGLYWNNDNNNGVTQVKFKAGEKFRVQLTFSDASLAYTVTNKTTGSTYSGTITTNWIPVNETMLMIENNPSISFFTVEKDGVIKNHVVPAIDEFTVPVLYDKISGKKILAYNEINQNLVINGIVMEIINVDNTSGRVGTYDEIRAEYEQFLEDGVTQCTYDFSTAANRLFPDEMMDWMCESIFGFKKTWSGDLEDIPVELLM